ncbi:MAG: hypothetical protein LGR52_02120 [Candidatus Thiosymbion ectosymbiont of Robbea hypermnestra]|nr:hypothetical protein [Candidatus Thiosymbion ectosymbiont of Robbea hypermnestra]
MINRRKAKPPAAFARQAAAPYPQQSLHRERIRNFRNLIKHLIHLRSEGLLTDDDFSALVEMASATFIEAEVATKVAQVIDNKLSKEMKNQLFIDYLLGL